MAKKVTEKNVRTNKHRVTFTVEAAPGKTVAVAGSFNDWDPDKKPLEYKAEKGVYSGVVMLEPGSYEYKFVIDGEWQLDENNPNFSHNDFGSLNSVVVIK